MDFFGEDDMRNGPFLRILAGAAAAAVLAVFDAAPADAGYACVFAKSDYKVYIDGGDSALGRNEETISNDSYGYCVGKKNLSFSLKLRAVDGDGDAGDPICTISVGADDDFFVTMEKADGLPECNSKNYTVTYANIIASWVRNIGWQGARPKMYFPIEMVGDPDDADDTAAWCIYNWADYWEDKATREMCNAQDY